MSIAKVITIMCDAPSCGEWWDTVDHTTAAAARRNLRRLGWVCGVPNPGPGKALDFCPQHAGGAP